MDAYGPSSYGDRIAEVYDELYEDGLDAGGTVEFIWQLGRGGKVLELGIGTGRIALPLHQMGGNVHGIDASEAMIAKLRAKPDGDRIPVTVGDFEHFELHERFDVVFVVFNTLFSLQSQEEQINCFRSVERHLAEDGLFVVEAFVPDPTRFERNQRLAVERIEPERLVLEASVHDPARQRVEARHVLLSDKTRIYPVCLRYAWPAEIDLMARLAGLRLRDRWGGWRREPFTSSSASHVSVYERDASAP